MEGYNIVKLQPAGTNGSPQREASNSGRYKRRHNKGLFGQIGRIADIWHVDHELTTADCYLYIGMRKCCFECGSKCPVGLARLSIRSTGWTPSPRLGLAANDALLSCLPRTHHLQVGLQSIPRKSSGITSHRDNKLDRTLRRDICYSTAQAAPILRWS